MKGYFIIPLITLITALGGSSITTKGLDWYKKIKLPSFTPPGSTIGLVWTIIFFLATASALIVYKLGAKSERFSLIVFAFIANALLNVCWSFLFFGLHNLQLAFIEAIILEISVLVLIILIWPVSRLAAYLLMPYSLWVAFASFLTFKVLSLNS
jgi:tryptophan-rich sensory protein